MYWYGSRAYDPLLGRFVQPDSIVPDYRNPQALNRYSYVLNNPVRYADPTGHEPWDPDDGGSGASSDQPDGEGDLGGASFEWPEEVFDLEVGPYGVRLGEQGADNDISNFFTSLAVAADTVDFSVTSGFAELYGGMQFMSFVGGPETAGAVFAADSALWAGLNTVLTVVDVASLFFTGAADLAAGRTIVDSAHGRASLGVDTSISAINLIGSRFLSLPAPSVYAAVAVDGGQLAYDSARGGGEIPGYSFSINWWTPNSR